MSLATMGPQRYLLCDHQPTGTVAWPAQRPEHGPCASVYSCDRPDCVWDATRYVQERTGHPGVYRAFAAVTT